jgi:hypothetical protein
VNYARGLSLASAVIDVVPTNVSFVFIVQRNFGLYAGELWCYRASMCPMEAIHGRQSLLQ